MIEEIHDKSMMARKYIRRGGRRIPVKKISVIVPCHNVAKYLERCMERIINQSIGMEEIELILIDDASTDNGATLQVLMDYERRFPDTVMLIPLEQNMRQGGARNIGISYAGGEYLMFCDADDWLAYRAMEILYHVAKEYDADVVEYRYKTVTDTKESGELIEQGNGSYYREMDNEDVKRKLLVEYSSNFSLGCMRKLYRTSLIKDNAISFAEHLICEEPSFTVPVRLYEKKHVFLDAELYYYLQRSDSTTHSKWDDRKWDHVKVWLLLMDDLKRRGFMDIYHDELECMMYDWGWVLSVRMMVQKEYAMTLEELRFLKQTVLQMFPSVLYNPYVMKREEKSDDIMKFLLRTELTEKIVQEMNQTLAISGEILS